MLYLNEDDENEALLLFKENVVKKGFSYTDATTIVAMRRYKIGFLLSFDQRSFSGLVERIARAVLATGMHYLKTSGIESLRWSKSIKRGTVPSTAKA